MELEKQVCSLNLAKRLRELGVNQESMFWHWATDIEQDGLTWWTVAEKEPRRGKKVREMSTRDHYRGKVSAFTVAELGEILPESFLWEGVTHVSLRASKYSGGWRVSYRSVTKTNGKYNVNHAFHAETEADARANMLIYIIEQQPTSKTASTATTKSSATSTRTQS